MDELEKIKHIDDGKEYWLARELMLVYDYKEWRNFDKVINRAKSNCLDYNKHFRIVKKRIKTNKTGWRYINDYKLTRYACYLISLYCDIRKDAILNAQSYFKNTL